MTPPRESRSERVLILAPTGRDARLIDALLGEAGVEAISCRDLDDLTRRLDERVGAILLAEEALTPAALRRISEALVRQPSWSDIPVIVTTIEGEASEAMLRTVAALAPAGSVTALERPFRKATLTTTVSASLRARRRQYEQRDLLRDLEIQTSQLAAERELRERFVSLLAHDLRGPLAVAKMAVHQLMVAPDRRLDLKVKIDRNLDRMERMITDLLDANLIQAGQRLPLRLAECDLSAVALEVVEDLNNVQGPRLELGGEASLLGWWSAAELRRPVWNLAANAVKYGSPDFPAVVRVARVGDRAELSVHNEGPAIPVEEQAGLFEPYRRTRPGASGPHPGWGLGLTLVRGCAEAHGGSARLQSAPGRGTTFTISLPLDARLFQAGPRSKVAEGPPDDDAPAEPHSLH